MNNKAILELSPGSKLNNNELRVLFLCSTQGGMRRSIKTNTLVLICNHVSSIYDDRWIDNILYYTGMGQKGDQSFGSQQNKTLYESQINGVGLHLFEVFKDKEYTYTGRVHLVKEPYFEMQNDSDGALRKVCIFPLSLQDGSRVVLKEDVDSMEQAKIKLLNTLSNDELYTRALSIDEREKGSIRVVSDYRRDLIVTEFAKRWVNGICQLCNQTAPFKTKKNGPYLEVHHIKWLSRGGRDNIYNTVALCPNCHRKMHVLDDREDVDFLKEKVLNFLDTK